MMSGVALRERKRGPGLRKVQRPSSRDERVIGSTRGVLFNVVPTMNVTVVRVFAKNCCNRRLSFSRMVVSVEVLSMLALHHIERGSRRLPRGIRPSSALERFAMSITRPTCTTENGYVAGGPGQ